VLIAALRVAWLPAPAPSARCSAGCGLLAAMLARLAWLRWRSARCRGARRPTAVLPALPSGSGPSLSAGLPLALPFAARSLASQRGAGRAGHLQLRWKLVGTALVLAVQLVATLASGRSRRRWRRRAPPDDAAPPCAAASRWPGRWPVPAPPACWRRPALAQLLFGWGRMQQARWRRSRDWGASAPGPAAAGADRHRAHAAGRAGPHAAAVLAYALALLVLLARPAAREAAR
jgi:hypothetical protein